MKTARLKRRILTEALTGNGHIKTTTRRKAELCSFASSLRHHAKLLLYLFGAGAPLPRAGQSCSF